MNRLFIIGPVCLSFCFPIFSQEVQLTQESREHNFVTLRNNDVVDIGKYVRVLDAWDSKPRDEDRGTLAHGQTTIRIVGKELSDFDTTGVLFNSGKWLVGLTFDWSDPHNRITKVEMRLVNFTNIKSLTLTQGAVLDLISDNPIRFGKIGYDLDPGASGDSHFKVFAPARALNDFNEYIGCRNLHVCH